MYYAFVVAVSDGMVLFAFCWWGVILPVTISGRGKVMRRILYQWAAIGILSLTGWGVDVMPSNTSWIPSTILWGIAGIWFIATLIYWAKHRHKISSSDKEQVANPLETIKSDLIALNQSERDAAIKKAGEACSIETALQIYNDFTSIFSTNIVRPIMTILQETASKRSVDPLIDFYKKFGDILDSNKYGLKNELENDDQYKTSRADLANNRTKLKMGKKKKCITQKNIDRVRLLSYGLSSSVLLRSVLDTSPEARKVIPAELKIALEGIETDTEQTLNTMLNDLDNDWTLPQKTIDGIETVISALSILEGLER